ncbi:type II secretion system F family protein [Sediminibacillus massiliensis]|uniref:type II secretion system F family protein n=1 Tax=Sediminibacillus massiliensis TaxID=1926277 RepID=UPI000988637C|nr:type II secretion system F family protein [Sediminibacillus massiliensis]
MTSFQYKGRTEEGKLKQGKIAAETRQDALSILHRKGLTVFFIKELKGILHKEINIRLSNRIKTRDFVLFLRQFATLVEAGISLVEATGTLSEQTESKQLKHALQQVKDELEEGTSLSEAMGKNPAIFPKLLVNMVHAGEISGSLDEILDRMAAYYEKQYRLTQKVKTSLAYPLVIGTIAFLVTMFLLIYIVPTFADMFVSFGEEIPSYTAFILNVSSFFKAFWWMIVLMAILGIFLYRYLNEKENFHYHMDRMFMRLPIFGNLLKKSALARMTRTLSSLLNSSVPIIQSVQITEQVVQNRVIKKVLSDSRDSLERGESMVGPMANHWAFPPMIIQMIQVGEKSGSMDEMLKKAADFYEEELDQAAEKLKSLIEPLMIVLLTVVVGAIVMAIIIPMFSIFESI